METKIFDKETMLDLVVNFIPLGILLFFITAFIVWSPWGFDLRYSGPMFAIMGGMFIALVVLTYFSAKAVAGDEKTKPVYPQGQAGLKGAKTVHELEAEIEGEYDDHESDAELGADGEPNGTTSGDNESETDDTDGEHDEAAGDDAETTEDTVADAETTEDTVADAETDDVERNEDVVETEENEADAEKKRGRRHGG